jgi:hypothetical protein
VIKRSCRSHVHRRDLDCLFGRGDLVGEARTVLVPRSMIDRIQCLYLAANACALRSSALQMRMVGLLPTC